MEQAKEKKAIWFGGGYDREKSVGSKVRMFMQ